MTYSAHFQIVHEDRDLLIVNKRPGVLTMGQNADEPSVLSAARHYLLETSPAAHGFVAIVGRLDFPVAGLMLVAKNPPVADQLWKQQADGHIRKLYLAVVEGTVGSHSRSLGNWLVKSKRRRHVEIVEKAIEGAQWARLRYRVVARGKSTTCLAIKLQTGRKHQIRAQLSHIGFPVVGDTKYGAKRQNVTGIGLVCRRIRLIHPATAKPMVFDVDLPPAWPCGRP